MPTPINMLPGDNNMWEVAGDMAFAAEDAGRDDVQIHIEMADWGRLVADSGNNVAAARRRLAQLAETGEPAEWGGNPKPIIRVHFPREP